LEKQGYLTSFSRFKSSVVASHVFDNPFYELGTANLTSVVVNDDAFVFASALIGLGRKTLGRKSSRAEIKGVNVASAALLDVEQFS
jgi:hypothetical protein